MSKAPIFVAIDTTDLAQAKSVARGCTAHVAGVKLGLEFFLAHGRAGVEAVAAELCADAQIFLDLKLHDIPNTVDKAIRALVGLPIAMLTIHASGGAEMIARAAQATHMLAQGKGGKRPLLLAVTVLTSLDAVDIGAIGMTDTPEAQVVRLARLAQASGADGVICSPQEIGAIRAACGPSLALVVPGIRPEGTAADDQKRTLTPREALAAGAHHLVIGRPITQAENPTQTAEMIVSTLQG